MYCITHTYSMHNSEYSPSNFARLNLELTDWPNDYTIREPHELMISPSHSALSDELRINVSKEYSIISQGEKLSEQSVNSRTNDKKYRRRRNEIKQKKSIFRFDQYIRCYWLVIKRRIVTNTDTISHEVDGE